MRRFIAVAAVIALGCADPAPTATGGAGGALAPSFSIGSDGAPPLLFNTQLRSEDEIPASTSESKGHSHLALRADGTILGLRDRFTVDGGAYNPLGIGQPYNTASHLVGP